MVTERTTPNGLVGRAAILNSEDRAELCAHLTELRNYLEIEWSRLPSQRARFALKVAVNALDILDDNTLEGDDNEDTPCAAG